MKFSRYNAVAKSTEDKVVFCNSLTGALGSVENHEYDTIVEYINNGGQTELTEALDKTIKDFLKAGIIVNDYESEFKRMIYLKNVSLYRSDFLDLRILPTEDCNCRCVYCYESFDKGEMKPEIRNRVIKLLEKKAPFLKELRIGWFGGEPLMAMETIKELTSTIKELKDKYKFSYNPHLTTNGYFLTTEIVNDLFSMEIYNIQVTFDGYKEKHDERKKQINGDGTFDVMYKNIINLTKRDDDFKLSIRVNFDQDNIDSIKTLLTELKTATNYDKRINVFFRATGNWGGENELSNYRLVNRNVNSIQEMLSDIYYDDYKRGIEIPSINSMTCYASHPNCYTIGSDGSIYKCTVYFESAENKIGLVDEEGNIKIDVNKAGKWTEYSSDDEECLKCFLYPSCQGKSCPAQRAVFNKKICPDKKGVLLQDLARIDDFIGERSVSE